MLHFRYNNDPTKMYFRLLRASNIFPLLLLLCLFSSCYSIRLANINGAFEPNSSAENNEPGFYADKKFTSIDTSVRLKIYETDAMFLESCEAGGFYSVEYRVNLFDILWSGITFGTRKKVRVKYVCLKPQE